MKALGLALLPFCLLAQTGTSVVKGTIQDSSGALIPNAKVTLTNLATNVPRVGESSAAGLYYLPSLPPGRYNLTVEATGFKKWNGSVILEVGQTAVIDVRLDLGSVDTVVEVADAAPVIALEGSAVGDVKDAARIRQLPLNGRQIANLFNLTAGVEGGGNPRVNGLKIGSAEMLLDGVSLVDRFGGGINRVQPGLDTIEEFRIETTGSSAQYSRPATVELVTKSGTNQFHGSLFETHRNNYGGLRARQRQDGNTAAKLIRNEYGLSAGGPVYLPKLYEGKNKTFWFAAYEANRQRQLAFYSDTVPLAEMWSGNFSRIIDSTGRQTHIYDPASTAANGSRVPFAGDIIPQSRIHPFFKVVEGITHLPTNGANPFQTINMQEFYPQRTDTGSFTTRIDHRFSDKDSIAGRFTRTTRDFSQSGGRFGSPRKEATNGFGSGRGNTPIHSASIRHTHLFTNTLFHDLQAITHRTANSNGTLADDVDWPGQLGLPNPFGARGWPTFCAGDYFCWDADNRKDEKLTQHGIESNTTWIRGKHTVKFGGKVRYEYDNIRELQQSQGSHDFGPAWTSLYDAASDESVTFTGEGFASMALGLPTYLSNQYNRGYFYFEQQEFGLYAQDTWRVTPRLTLDLGLRWDKWTPYTEKYNRQVNLDLANLPNRFEVITPGSVRMESLPGVPPAVLQSWAARGLKWRTADEAGLPGKLIPADNDNFGPRIGAAYRLGQRFVLRGGYGEYFWTMPLSQILQTSRINPPLNLRFENVIGSLDGTDSFAIRTAPRPDFLVGRAGVDTNGIVGLPPSARSMMAWDTRNWRDGHSRAFNVTIESEVLRNTALRLSYIGTQGRDLEQRFSLNAREAEFNYVARTRQNPPANRDLLRVNKDWALFAASKTGFSNTNSLQAEIERRFTSGIGFQVFYTFTRSLNTSDAGGFTSGNGNINDTAGTPEVPDNIQLLGGGNLNFDERLRLVYYNSAAIPAQRVRWNAIYDLPFGKDKKWARRGGVSNLFLGGWQLAPLGEWRSGNWLSVAAANYVFGDPTLNADQRLLLTFNGRPQRLWFRGNFNPALATNVDQQALQALVAPRIQDRIVRPLGPNADNRLPQTLANGTTRQTPIGDTLNPNPRGFFRGPGAWNLDLAVYKNFALAPESRKSIQFMASFFNLTNSPMDPNPNGSTGLQDLATQPNEPRIVQFSLRFSW